MTATDITSLLPLIVLSVTACVLVLQLSLKRNHLAALSLTLLGLGFAFLTLFRVDAIMPHRVSSLLLVDSYAILFGGIIIISAVFAVVLSFVYLSRRDEHREEMYVLILLSTIGSFILAAADHFVSLILGLEILTVTLYVMISYLRETERCLEAGIKYLILAAASSAFMLFGMALVYAATGSMEFSALAFTSAGGAGNADLYILVGTVLILVGAGFKLGVVPFHLWVPDVYEGAPAPVTAFVATVSKTGMVALLLRYSVVVSLPEAGSLLVVLGLIAVASMIFGNLLALLQVNLKRLLAYSSIAHLGYVLVALVAVGSHAVEAVAFYMLAYSFTTIGAFGLVAFISPGEHEAADLAAYRGLFWKRPFAATILAVMLLSLAGIPLTAGFLAKFFVLGAGVNAAFWTPVIVLVVTSAIGLFYYLRVLATMLASTAGDSSSSNLAPITVLGGATLAVITLAIIYIGAYPAPVFDLIRRMVSAFLAA